MSEYKEKFLWFIQNSYPMLVSENDPNFFAVKDSIPYLVLGGGMYLTYIFPQRDPNTYLFISNLSLEEACLDEEILHSIACDNAEYITPGGLEINCPTLGLKNKKVLFIKGEDFPGSGLLFNEDFMKNTLGSHFPEGYYVVTPGKLHFLVFSKSTTRDQIYRTTRLLEEEFGKSEVSGDKEGITDSYIPIFTYDASKNFIRPITQPRYSYLCQD